MNRYNNEKVIISDFQEFNRFSIGVYPNNRTMRKLLNSIYNKKRWKNWVDSSSKTDLPPDFYNTDLKLMMDVMRIDDHTYVDKNGKIVNPHNKRESELVEELIKKNPNFKRVADQGNLFITPYTGLGTDDDHNYNFYKDTFKRVVENHIKKIKNYKKNHPGYKIVFFVLDESSPYISNPNRKKIYRVGEKVCAALHYWWYDKNLLECLYDSEVDYLVWMTPYKHFTSLEQIELPRAVVLDIKELDYNNLIVYDPKNMQSLEL